MKTEAEIGVMLPQAKECQGGCPEGIKGKKRYSREPLEETQSFQHLDFLLLASRTVR